MAKNAEQLKNTYENGMRVLTDALGSETTIRKLGNSLYVTLETTKKAAQEIVTDRTMKDPNSFDFTEIEVIDTVEKELRKNAIAKALLEGGFAAEDAAVEKNQSRNTSSNGVTTENNEEEIIEEF